MPLITAPARVTAYRPGYQASVLPQAGCTFQWSITGGVLTAGMTGTSVTFTPSGPGNLTLACAAINADGKASPQGSARVDVLASPAQPVIVAPSSVETRTPGLNASIAAQDGMVVTWTLVGGQLTSSSDSTHVEFTSGSPGKSTLSCKVANALGDSAEASAEIVVTDAPPRSLTYTLNPAVYPLGVVPIQANLPATTGGLPTSYAISPGLPAGLGLSTTTGVISGAPLVAALPTSYTITASNALGSCSTDFTLTIYPYLPSILRDLDDKAVAAGDSATWVAVVSAAEPIQYQWYRNGVAIPGATLATYVTPALGLGDSGATYGYRAVDAYGNAISSRSATVEIVEGRFVLSQAHIPPRRGGTATRLGNGLVLVAGGDSAGSTVAYLYDPGLDAASATGAMAKVRGGHTATLLLDGRVLMAGPDASAEIYDPATGQFTALPQPPLSPSVAVMMKNGKVLLGADGSMAVFDPAGNTFYPVAGSGPTVKPVVLNDGMVFLGNGLFDPSKETTVALTGDAQAGLAGRTARGLADGNVLLCQGGVYQGAYVASDEAELFMAGTRVFTPLASKPYPAMGVPSAMLADGRILLPGGTTVSGGMSIQTGTAKAMLFNPATLTFSRTGDLPEALFSHAVATLQDGRVLVTGGATSANPAGTGATYLYIVP